MEFDKILKLIDHVSGSHLESFCYENDGMKLTLNNKNAPIIVSEMPPNSALNSTELEKNSVVYGEKKNISERILEGNRESDSAGNIVKSPLVGTFYAAPSEDAPAFVKIGDRVKKGQILSIVEAMKLMNEIESDFDGEVAEIMVENGQPVEYGQPLFVIR